MDKGDRGALAALGMMLAAIVIVVLFISGPRNPADYDVKQPNTAYVDQRQDSNVPELVSSTDDFHPWRDTYAQWMMAILSIAATAVSFWAVKLVGSTLKETRKASENSDKALEIARESNRNTLLAIDQERANAQRELRAYVYVANARVSDTSHSARVDAVLRIENFGHTPAKDVRITYWSNISTKGGDAFAKKDAVEFGNLDLAPRHTLPIAFEVYGDTNRIEVSIEGILAQAVFSQSAIVNIIGRIEYMDAFETPRWTEFHYIHDTGFRLVGNPITQRPEILGADFRPFKEGNKSN